MTKRPPQVFHHAAESGLFLPGATPIFNMSAGMGPIIILGPHNGHIVPPSLYDANGEPLGVSASWFDPNHQEKRHEACDWGVAELFTVLEPKLSGTGCHLLSANYSRLVVDLNRIPDPEICITTNADEWGWPIPGNQDLPEGAAEERIAKFHSPWHGAIRQSVKTAKANNPGVRPLILDLHSFTPHWQGGPREVDIGTLILDPKNPISQIAEQFIAAVCQELQYRYAPDTPYSPRGPKNEKKFAAKKLCELFGVDYYGIEIRNDHAQDPKHREVIANMIAELVKVLLPIIMSQPAARPDHHRRHHPSPPQIG